MTLDANSVIIVIIASILSGMGTALVSGLKESKREKIRRTEREQDMLKLELKDLEIKLYKLEKDLIEWRDKYYAAVQELIEVKAELEDTLIKLNHIKRRRMIYLGLFWNFLDIVWIFVFTILYLMGAI